MGISKLLSWKTEILVWKHKKKLNCFIPYIKININRKWIHPCDSWGPEDFKTGIVFKNWPIMKPIPSKTKSEYPFLILAKGERKEKVSNILA